MGAVKTHRFQIGEVFILLLPPISPPQAVHISTRNLGKWIQNAKQEGNSMDTTDYQVGPEPIVISWVYNLSYPFIRSLIGVITLFATCRGPLCMMLLTLSLNFVMFGFAQEESAQEEKDLREQLARCEG